MGNSSHISASAPRQGQADRLLALGLPFPLHVERVGVALEQQLPYEGIDAQ